LGETMVPAPFPRLSATPGRIDGLGEQARVDGRDALRDWPQRAS
jgi:hypothetical protein